MNNLNDFAKEITESEGKVQSISIGQVKEVLRLTFQKIANMDPIEMGKFFVKILTKYRH